MVINSTKNALFILTDKIIKNKRFIMTIFSLYVILMMWFTGGFSVENYNLWRRQIYCWWNTKQADWIYG